MSFCFMRIKGSTVINNPSIVYCQGKGSHDNLFVCLYMPSKM